MSIFPAMFYEFKHFSRSRAKVIAYVFFVLACLYATKSGFDLQSKQQETLVSIEKERQEAVDKVAAWLDEGKKGPEGKAWIDVGKPYWVLRYMPTNVTKPPSPLLPLGIGQAETYGHYKTVDFWSSTYDKGMVEELANPERLVNGNIDFSFLTLFLLPVVLIIFTHNVGGLERDSRIKPLIAIQSGSLKQWLLGRMVFYALLLIATVASFIVGVGFVNEAWAEHGADLVSLLALATAYVLVFSAICYGIVLSGSGSGATAFKMIGVWLLVCVIIPGAVHQYASMKHPVSYMTDYLDVSRKETYETYALPQETLVERLEALYPALVDTEYAQAAKPDKGIVRQTVSAVINDMNKTAIEEIEEKNEAKNRLIESSYWYNPITYVQNRWNATTETDYHAYKGFRDSVQQAIDAKMALLVIETWDKQSVDKATFERYLQTLN